MKLLIVYSVFLALLTSCGISRHEHFSYSGEIAKGLDKSNKTFVLKKESTLILCTNIEIKQPLLKEAKFILDKKLEIPAKDIVAFQDYNGYFAYTDRCGFNTRRTEIAAISKYVGTYTTNNTNYSQTNSTSTNISTYNTTSTNFQNFIQKGNGPIVYPTPQNVKQMVADYPVSASLMDDYFNKMKVLKSKGRLNGYIFLGGTILAGILTKDNTGKIALKGHNFAGFGIMAASYISFNINVHKKRKIEHYVTDAIEQYNGYFKRNK